MTDVAAFERIAAAVLRAANPPLYANLSHPGVQPGGKTVKAPFDNVGWVQSAEGVRFVCAAHTTEQKDLEGKWLHDPVTVKPRKVGGKPTKPAGDLVKGIAEIQKLREAHPGLAVTFALTTNRETSLDLRVSVEARAHVARIELDVWPISRIAHFLDTDPTGQIIRRNHLGTPVKLMSRELLLEMGKRSIRDHLPLAVARESIRRDDFILGRGDTLVVGASGMGKTTACATALDAHIENGLPAVVLKTEFLATAATMEAALESEFRRQEPELEAGAGSKALALCTGQEPLLVLVEDVNRTDSPGLLLNKVLSWTRASVDARGFDRLWRAVCPVWSRYLDAIEDQKRVLATVAVLLVDKYSPAEAMRAIRKRADVLGLQMDEYSATSIARRLGHDPLLIGLHDLTSEGSVAGVIQTYVGERLGIVASQAQRTKSEVLEALHQLLRCMLQHRSLDPRWIQVKSWFADHDVIALLRHIACEGSVMRMSQTEAAETLEFRHDRVMYSLLSEALAEVLKTDPPPDYATDPFFSEVVAGAAVQVQLPLQQLRHLMDATPAAAAHALKLASELGSGYTDIAARALSQWLQREDVKGEALSNQRYAVAHVLAETTDPYVRELVAQFPTDDYSWYPLLAASFRNGNLGAGLALLSKYEIGMTVAGKQSLLALVKSMYGRNLVAAVDAVLRSADLRQPVQAGTRVGALRLAGYLGDSSLAQAIRVCWDQDEGREGNLRSYLFAAARCCGDDPEATLGPVCDAWEALPEEPDSKIGQPAERLAADNVAWEFRTYTPIDAVRYLVERANASEKIGWPITYMLRTVDHPDAVEQLARYAARAGYVTAIALKSDWERHSREAGRRMSSESKKRLLKIGLDETEADDVQKAAFTFWELTLDDADLEIARQIPVGSPLHERALWARARRQDRSVIPEVVKKIPEAPEHWLFIERYLWSDALTEALDPLLDKVAEEQGEGYTNLEYAVAKALGRVEPRRVVAMLSCRWTKLKAKPLLVQTALLSTDPEAARLARDALTTSQSPNTLLKHFVTNAAIDSDGKTGLYSPDQLRNLRPYLDLFPDEEIEQLWETCTKRGWLDFRAQCLEPRLRNIASRHVRLTDDPVDTQYLDRALAGEMIHLFPWLDLQAGHGLARDKVVAEMLEWLGRHDEDRALAIVCEIVSREATRREFQLFEAAVAQRADAVSRVKAVRFDVFSRSLV
ncbi:hypothetical protein [Burkholderia multivorans]|uniref:hypothetical protein n=1 Tax=Burkholderia multivorans TaxID=87883 RepID=UPI00209FC758|nr:hypothetical protein [Burkholderia multivorans]MCO8629446.1 hypothetical protein [Burkholderia multivorans]